MKAKTYKGIGKEGRFIPDNREAFKTAFYGFEGKKCQVVISNIRRSIKQNSYLWAVVYEMIRSECGYLTTETVHFEMQMLFWFMFGKTGEKIPKGTSNEEMTTSEMENYLSKIRAWASDFLNLYIPLPNE